MRKIISTVLVILLLLTVSNSVVAEEIKNDEKLKVLSSTSIFKPLIADAKWPRFTLGYQNYSSGPYGRHVFAPNFGAALPMIRNEDKSGTTYELSVHAGLFAVMDVGSSPSRLINADYFVGPAVAIKKGASEYIVRVAHTSSHLGDEFMLSPQGKKVKRINLSYEVLEGIMAYNLDNGLRPYLGIGYIVNAEPNNYKTAEFALGIDYRSPHTILGGFAKPIFGIHSKTSGNYNWNPSLSVKGGLEVEDRVFIGKKLQVLLEYYTGNSIHGQFYKKRVSYIGTSLNINF